MCECFVKFIKFNKFLTGMFVWEGYFLKILIITSMNLLKNILIVIFFLILIDE
jgi:hypothetical protein